MLENVRIRNFRNLIDLQIEGLDRVNLFTGRNNSGKTALLEALFLLGGAGNPGTTLTISAFRGIESLGGLSAFGQEVLNVMGEIDPVGGSSAVVREILWKPMFSSLDMNRGITIEAEQTSHEPLRLRIALKRPDTIQLPLEQPSGLPITDGSNEGSLLFSFDSKEDKPAERSMRVMGRTIQIDPPTVDLPFPVMFLASRSGNIKEDAVRLGQLRKRKRSDMVTEALKIVEPRLQSIEDNSAGGTPMIWGDIGLPELVPLPVMGEGMTRVARLILAISTTPGGLLLVDEIENGLHHSILSKVWKAVDQAAKNFDTQIVATTHSYECLEAAHEALGKDGVHLYRLEAKNGENRCVTYEPEAIEAAIYHNLEVR